MTIILIGKNIPLMQPIAADEMEREKNRSQHQRSKKYVKFASERANLDKGIVRTH